MSLVESGAQALMSQKEWVAGSQVGRGERAIRAKGGLEVHMEVCQPHMSIVAVITIADHGSMTPGSMPGSIGKLPVASSFIESWDFSIRFSDLNRP